MLASVGVRLRHTRQGVGVEAGLMMIGMKAKTPKTIHRRSDGTANSLAQGLEQLRDNHLKEHHDPELEHAEQLVSNVIRGGSSAPPLGKEVSVPDQLQGVTETRTHTHANTKA